MKSIVKGKLLKKLKTIKSIGYLKPERFLHVNASDGYFEASSPPKSTQFNIQKVEDKVEEQDPEIIDVSELMRDLEDEEIESDDGKENVILKSGYSKTRVLFESDDGFNDKENISPKTGDNENRGFSLFSNPEEGKLEMLEESKIGETRIDPLSNFRRPSLYSCSLFDPKLLAAFEEAVIEFKAQEAERRARIKELEKYQALVEEPPLKAQKIDENRDPLLEFEEKSPPGGSNSVILYTTSLRSIRKTFEDCHKIRFLLQNFKILFFERDISMHSEFREELWQIMGEKTIPPCLFIKGRFIGRADRVLMLHEQGKLRALFNGLPMDRAEGPCDGCGGARFVVCFNCNGSRKVVVDDDIAVLESCEDCNENGLIICPLCCLN